MTKRERKAWDSLYQVYGWISERDDLMAEPFWVEFAEWFLEEVPMGALAREGEDRPNEEATGGE